MRRSISKTLICPVCAVVIAEATYKPWSASLVLVSPDGVRVQPEGVAAQLRRAQAQPHPDDARVAFLRRHLDELVYDLRCRNGHSTLRTMPQLVRAIRNAQGQWVDLA